MRSFDVPLLLQNAKSLLIYFVIIDITVLHDDFVCIWVRTDYHGDDKIDFDGSAGKRNIILGHWGAWLSQSMECLSPPLGVLHVLCTIWTSLVHRPLSAFPSTPDIGGVGRGRERSARTQSLEPNRSLHFFALLSTCYTSLRLKLGSKTDLLYTVRVMPPQIPKYTVPWSQMGPTILLQSQTY